MKKSQGGALIDFTDMRETVKGCLKVLVQDIRVLSLTPGTINFDWEYASQG